MTLLAASKKEEKSGHEANSCCLAGANVEKLPKFHRQRAQGHRSYTLQLLLRRFAHAGGVQTRAAQALGIGERALGYKLKKYGLQDNDVP